VTGFADVEQRLGLKKYLSSPLGTLYFNASDQVLVRRFDGALPPALREAYTDLTAAAQRWIDRHPRVAELARVQQPTEVGTDYVARPLFAFTPTGTYYDLDAPADPPAEWVRLFAAVGAVPPPVDPRDAIVANVVRRSLLEPNGKTYFDAGEGRFVVVEPRLSAEDVRSWADLDELEGDDDE
jgi:hypothetical protein